MPRVRRSLAALALTAALSAAGAAVAPAAIAEPNPVPPSRSTCGWTTCTYYWSVDRTAEFNNEWKDAVLAGYAGSAGAFDTGAAVAAGSTAGVGAVPAAVAAGVVDGALLYKASEFAVQISSAANDHRCLIYKYPRKAPTLGWWGSVHLNNSNCDQSD